MTPGEVLTKLIGQGATIAFGESLTGGLLAHAFISVPGASAAVRGSIIAYDTQAKHTLLGVDQNILDTYGAVDPRVASAMAIGARHQFGATYGLSTTGVAGPDPQDGQEVGTVHIGFAHSQGSDTLPLLLDGNRQEIRDQTVIAAVKFLARNLA